ncbi:unnamed protein product [Rotaria magnacalcarata]|uniref:Uncharacterized protein n=2 Tax=Rotaria magnacalcarata TaxID=392030 RepID=A0A8S2VDU6_9BILA|nr:unnamed protein product [Rotaria magnacalcarata]CAF4652431.1 unnamed protein product [Rotaria magnacalcarata]
MGSTRKTDYIFGLLDLDNLNESVVKRDKALKWEPLYSELNQIHPDVNTELGMIERKYEKEILSDLLMAETNKDKQSTVNENINWNTVEDFDDMFDIVEDENDTLEL